jgi:hypothetical protein
MTVTLVMVADLPAEGVEAFAAYEAVVLPLLPRHGGVLQRRLRTPDGLTEVHVVSFASREGYDAYLVDPERTRHRGLLASVDLRQRIVEVADVELGTPPSAA